jgi:hypothetical protein
MGWQSEDDYKAALERIREARFLHDHGYFVVAMYLLGLAVESLLRAFRLLRDSTLEFLAFTPAEHEAYSQPIL